MSPAPHPELAVVLLQVVAILGVSRLLAIAARRLGQPAAVAEIVAGVVLGPSLLGWLAPQVFEWLFPPTAFAGLRLLSQLGLVLFMFLVGLELDPKLLRGRTHTSLLVGGASLATPLVLGLAAAPWLHARYGDAAPFGPFALFLAAATSVSAFPVLARILSERHLIATRVGAIATASAAIDDLAAWCFVTLLIAIARNDAWLEGLRVSALALGFVAGMLVIVRPLLARAVRRVERTGAIDTGSISVVVLVLLLLASVSELLGIHALFGAFLFGAILPRQGPLAEVLREKLETVTVALLLPVFFAYSGLRTQIGLIDQPADWLAILAVIVVATAGKLGGSALVGRLTGLSWREAGAVGVLLNTRGLMGLIVLNVGLDLGLVSPTLFTLLVIVALVTTLMTSPLLRLVYPDRARLEERFAAQPAPEAPAVRAPVVVLAVVDDPRSAPALAATAHALVGERPDRARVLGVCVEPLGAGAAPEAAPSAALDAFVDRAGALGLDARPLSFASGHAADDIARLAEAKRASMILLGASDPRVRGVLRAATSPVGVLVGDERTSPRGALDRVLVLDPRAPADGALHESVRTIAARFGARVTQLRRGVPSPALEWREPESLREVIARVATADRFDLAVAALDEPHDARLERTLRALRTSSAVPVLLVHDARAQAAADASERPLEESA